MTFLKIALPAVLVVVLSVPSAYGAVIGFFGAVTLISAPADARLHAVENDTVAPLFTEVEDLVLLSALAIDITAPGTYNGGPALGTPGIITAGTRVDSYYLINDPVGDSMSAFHFLVGSITFDTDVLGIIFKDASFAASNALVGHPGTLYSNSGIAYDALDQVVLSADLRTVSFSTRNAPVADNLRIVTAAVPEPAALLWLGTGAAGLAVRARRRQGRHAE